VFRVPFFASFSGLYIFDCPFGILWRLFDMCFVYLMLPVSLDCIFWLPLWYSLTFIWPVSCVPYVTSSSALYILDCPFGILWRIFVLCLVYPVLPVSLDCPFCIAPLVFSDVYLSCVLVYPMLSDSLDCPFVIAPLVFSYVYLFCVLHNLFCQFLWIVHFWLPLWYSLLFICLVSCVPYVVRFSGLSICDCAFSIL
jgi:hypothetical protein